MKNPLLLLLVILAGCTKLEIESNPEVASYVYKVIQYPDTKFAVLSDLHIMDQALVTPGKAFDNTLQQDRKMLLESVELFHTAEDDIMNSKPHFLLVTGDLTKDGEKQNHLLVARLLAPLQSAGIKVFVIPGNHDILNSDSVIYRGDTTEPAPTITAADFADIYKDFGYGNASSRDPSSLSYTVDPEPGLLLIGLDSVKYADNRPDKPPVVGGKITKTTLHWLEGELINAKKTNKAVIVFVHHGITPHYPQNTKYYPEYLLDNYKAVSRMLAKYGVALCFTGHYHAQDITRAESSNGSHFVYDIETGSLVTAPSPYRICTIKNNYLEIDSREVNHIPSKIDFVPWSQEYLYEGTKHLAEKKLLSYKVGARDRAILEGFIATAYSDHLQGDEIPTAFDTKSLSWYGKLIYAFNRPLLDGWMHDLNTPDNNVIINLTTGVAEKSAQ